MNRLRCAALRTALAARPRLSPSRRRLGPPTTRSQALRRIRPAPRDAGRRLPWRTPGARRCPTSSARPRNRAEAGAPRKKAAVTIDNRSLVKSPRRDGSRQATVVRPTPGATGHGAAPTPAPARVPRRAAAAPDDLAAAGDEAAMEGDRAAADAQRRRATTRRAVGRADGGDRRSSRTTSTPGTTDSTGTA